VLGDHVIVCVFAAIANVKFVVTEEYVAVACDVTAMTHDPAVV
jgi:hypothetical protein